MELISTGYKLLDEYLGGGLGKGSTNLIVERGGFLGRHRCLGDLFSVFLVKNRIDRGDIGLIDCFSFAQGKLLHLQKTMELI